jgi:hypothetical protein
MHVKRKKYNYLTPITFMGGLTMGVVNFMLRMAVL